jgi:nucleoid DNA-binding protein/nucleoid-associated protein YgaU
MSKLKINTSDWVELLAQQADISKKDADDFIKTLISVIEETLLSKDFIKINELGTFKLQWNAPRKSVDVNTGEDIVIDGYYRVAFTPDVQLRELANEPYAHLEAVVIDEIEEGQKVKKEADDTDGIPLKYFDEQATEIKDILSEINALNHANEQRRNKDEIDAYEQDTDEQNTDEQDTEKLELSKQEVDAQSMEELEVPEYDVDESAAEKSDVKEQQADLKTKDSKQKKRSDNDAKKQKMLDNKDKRGRKNSLFNNHEEKPKRVSTSKSRRLDFLFIGVLTGGLLVYLAVDLKVFTTISKYMDSYRIQKEFAPDAEKLTESPESEGFETYQSDFESVKAGSPVEDESIAIRQPQVDVLEQLFNQPRSYQEFIATEEVIPGSRLTRIAERHYGVKEFWVYIYEANRDVLSSPAMIAPGMLLKIPRLNPVLADEDNPKCIEYALQLQEKYLKE